MDKLSWIRDIPKNTQKCIHFENFYAYNTLAFYGFMSEFHHF